MADEEIEIQELDEPIEDEDDGLPLEKPKIVKPEEGIEALKSQLDAIRAEKEAAIARAEAADARAQKAEQDGYTARVDQHDSEIRLLASSIKDTEREIAILKAAKAEALANGEYDKVADYDVEIGQHLHNASKFREAHDHFKSKTIEKPARPGVNEFASSLPPKSASWIKAHPEFYTDPKLNAKLVHAHNFATTDHEYESDGYFAAVENMLGLATKPAASVEAAESPLSSAATSQARQREEAPTVAPVNRGGKSTVVTLSRAEREAADMAGMSHAEYAKAKISLQKEGRIGQVH